MRNARWSSPLGRFLLTYGTRRLARSLSVHQTAPYHWLARRTFPRPDHARAIVRLSHGDVNWNDIYGRRG